MTLPPLDAALAERLATDPHRPRYHFVPPAHWMNDPNGLIPWRGEYHLFYQHNPSGVGWGAMHWGHARSHDLVHWDHLPIALAPTPGGPDKDGCWSGCAVDDGGVPTLMYTGIRPQVQCLATGSPDLLAWTKHPGNPVIAAAPEGFGPDDFRDPRVWREEEGWHAAIGTTTAAGLGAVLHYRSPDLRTWEFVGPLLRGADEGTGRIWECPDFYALGDRHVLVTSPVPLRRTIWFSGAYDGRAFQPQSQGIVDHGGHFYAPQTLLDARGRRIMFGWVWEGRSPEAQRAAGWAGVMSLPRVMSLLPNGSLGAEPVAEVTVLRGEHVGYEGLSLSPGLLGAPADISGDTLELQITFEAGRTSLPDQADAFGLAVRRSPDGQEETRIAYHCRDQRLVVDRSRSSLDPDTTREVYSAPLPLRTGQNLSLRVYLDRSVIEVYTNDSACLTSRVYPTRADSLGVALWTSGGRVRVASLDAWTMASIG
jgi:beta-fructofuranosidase